MKLLILSVSAGNGHLKASEAIKDYYGKHYENVDVKIVDTLKYVNPLLDKVVIGSYLKSLSKAPFIYEKIYENGESDDSISNILDIFSIVISRKIVNLIEEYSPDVILCNHPFSIDMISMLKRRGKINIPAVTLLTDYAPHPFWFCDHIDSYIIPNEDFIPYLLENGILKDSIFPLGIPLQKSFTAQISKVKARGLLGLDKDKMTILLMGGGLGIGNINKIFEALTNSNLDIQIIACAGNNKRLKSKLLKLCKSCNKKTIIFDYTNRVSLLMSASDLIITKPGGLTVTEALIKKLPIVITSAIPGQEEKNSCYLLKNGIGARIRDRDNVIEILNFLFNNPEKLKAMGECAFKKAKPNSTRDICNYLLNIVNKGPLSLS